MPELFAQHFRAITMFSVVVAAAIIEAAAAATASRNQRVTL